MMIKKKDVYAALKVLLIITLSILLNAVVGKYIWNNVLVEVISGVKKITVTQMVLIHILCSILICRC